jgi:hypothetical protein
VPLVLLCPLCGETATPYTRLSPPAGGLTPICPYTVQASDHAPGGGYHGNHRAVQSALHTYAALFGVGEAPAEPTSDRLAAPRRDDRDRPLILGTCSRARTSGALPQNGANFCARIMRMTRNAYLRTAAFCLRTSCPT